MCCFRSCLICLVVLHVVSYVFDLLGFCLIVGLRVAVVLVWYCRFWVLRFAYLGIIWFLCGVLFDYVLSLVWNWIAGGVWCLIVLDGSFMICTFLLLYFDLIVRYELVCLYWLDCADREVCCCFCFAFVLVCCLDLLFCLRFACICYCLRLVWLRVVFFDFVVWLWFCCASWCVCLVG